MFIAHLPAGYLLTRAIQRRFGESRYLWIGLMASIFPDIDLLYFYFVDHRQTLHHEYWTHLPLFWATAWIATLIILLFLKNTRVLLPIGIFFTNIFLHLALDTFTGGISWLAPFLQTKIFLVHVPHRYPSWVLSFLLNWTFLIEIAIVVWAMVVLRKERGKRLRET